MVLMLDLESVGVGEGMLLSHLVVLVVIAHRVSYAFPGFSSVLFITRGKYHLFYLLENQLMTLLPIYLPPFSSLLMSLLAFSCSPFPFTVTATWVPVLD